MNRKRGDYSRISFRTVNRAALALCAVLVLLAIGRSLTTHRGLIVYSYR